MHNANGMVTAEITAYAVDAGAKFTGLDWDTGPSQLLAALKRGKRPSEDDLAGTYWADDGSAESQSLRARWGKLLAAVDSDATTEDLIEEAAELVEIEAEAVKAEAQSARDFAVQAAEFTNLGQWDDAIAAARKAESCERQYGDAPAWGGLVRLIERMPERLAAVDAEGDYSADSRSDTDIAADAVAKSTEAATAAISAGLAEGVDDLTAWADRYSTAWASEIVEWCAAPTGQG